MTWFQEKIFYSVTVSLAAGCLWLGTILTTGDVRWLYATGAASLMTSGFVGLALRKEGDSIRILISRTGIGIVGGVFGTKVLLHWFSSLNQLRIQTETDLMLLCGIATMVSALSHTLGYAIIKSADDSAQNIASRLLERMLAIIGLGRKPKE
jgi:hypothetical protein